MSLIGAWFVALGLVVLVSLATIGYGCLAAKFTRNNRMSLVLGLGFYCSAIQLTGIWGGYNIQVQTLFVAVGLASALTYRRQLRRFIPTDLPKGRDWLWLALPIAYFTTRFFSCGLPQQHSDPLYYHLAAPKYWVELGRILVTPEHPSFAQATLWEGLYGIPQIWLGTRGVDTHVIVELYGQWMHMFWGQLGCALLAADLLVCLTPRLAECRGLTMMVAWLCTTQPAFEWTGTLAKNDYIITLFALAALYEALDRKWWLAGLLMGFAFSTKILAVWGAVALLAFIPWKQARRSLLAYACGFGLAAIPILMRNLISTGNPFFPMLDQTALGPHWISSWWIAHNLSFGGAPKLSPDMLGWVWNKMFEKALPKIILGLGLVALVHQKLTARAKLEYSLGRWLVFLLVPTMLAFLMLRYGADGRYGNYTATAAAIFFMALVLREAHRLRWLWRFGWPALIALGLLINSPLDELVKIPRDYWFRPAAHYVEAFHIVYDMQAWVGRNVAPSDKIVFLAEKQQFYLDRPFETVTEMKKWEELLSPLRSSRELFELLRRQGYRYVHFSPQAGGWPIVIRPYWPQIVAIADQAVFKTPNSWVFDLNHLKSN